MLEGRVTIQRDIDRLEECVNRSLMKFNKEDTKSCTWDHLAVIQAGEAPAGEQLCREGPEGCGRLQAEHEPVMCSSRKGSQQDPGLY